MQLFYKIRHMKLGIKIEIFIKIEIERIGFPLFTLFNSTSLNGDVGFPCAYKLN